MPSDSTIYDAESLVVISLLVGGVLIALYRTLRRARPELRIGIPIVTTLGLHVAATVGVSMLGNARSLRGGDELRFMIDSRALSHLGMGSAQFTHAFTHDLHEWVFAVQFKLADFPEDALRITQVGIAAVGMMLIAVAVYDLAGARAARLTAWLIGLEPAALFFSGLLHKEALMVLASGLVVFGGSKVWRALHLPGVLLMTIGCFVGVATRNYAGWFLVASSAVLILHSAVRHLPSRPHRSAPVLIVTAVAIAAAIPAVLQASGNELHHLQVSQHANVTQAINTGANLRLEQVDFSSPSAIVTNLPKRVADLTFRPFPWQVANASQQLGVIGSLAALATLFFFVHTLVTRRGDVLSRAGPFIYPLLFLGIAYAISAGNAGTSFRYRAHLVALALAAISAIRFSTQRASVAVAEPVAQPGMRGREIAIGSAG
jgi:hypothetical protein